jgi:hypothetical protein
VRLGAAPAGPGARPARAGTPARASQLRTLAQDRVAQRAHDVQRLLVAEMPGPGRAGQLTGQPRALGVVVAAVARLQVPEDPLQGGGADAPDRLGRELEPAALAGEVALLGQLALERAQGLEVLDRAPPQGALERLDVHVVQGGARVVLCQGRLQRLQVGQLLQGGGGVAQPERLLAADHRALAPGKVRPALPQRLPEPVQLVLEPEVAQDRLGQRGQLRPLLRGQRAHQPAGRRRPARQRVDQLVEVARVLREEVPVLAHELVEARLRVLAAGVRVEQLVERPEHVLDPLHLLRAGVGERVAHAAELGVEHLAPQQVADLLVGLRGLGRAPLVVGELAHRPGGVVGELVQLGLGQPGGVGRVREQRPPLRGQRPVQQLLDPLQGAVQPAPAAGRPGPLPHPPA